MKKNKTWKNAISRKIAAMLAIVMIVTGTDMTAFATGENAQPEETQPVENIMMDGINYVKTGYQMSVPVTVHYNDEGTSVRELRPADLSRLFRISAGTNEQNEGVSLNYEKDYTVTVSAERGEAVVYNVVLPVYIREGSDGIGEETRYELPDQFYAIRLNTDDTTLWTGHIPDTERKRVSYTKDRNELIWTAQEMAFQCQKKSLKDAVFSMTWIDEDAGQRTDDITYQLYQSIGDGEKEAVEGIGAPEVNKSGSANTWILTYKNLPGENESGEQIHYYLQQKPNAYYITDCAPGSENYTVEGATTYNVLQETFTLHVEWNDAGEDGQACRPDLTNSIQIYEENEKTPIKGELEITKSDAQEGIDTYIIRSAAMPAYALTGTKINYFAKIEPSGDLATEAGGQTFAVKDGFVPKERVKAGDTDNLRYAFVYNNKPNSTSVTECIDGGSIAATLQANTFYQFTKEWKYQEDDKTAKANYEKLKDKVTLYLWRYSENKPDNPSAVTNEAGKQYSYVFNMEEGKTVSFTHESFGIPKDGLDAYDEMGYRYIYFAKEVLPADSGYRQEVFDGDTSKKNSDLADARKLYVLNEETGKHSDREKESHGTGRMENR